ncbi:MAG: hypothetical protein CL920_25300 [Deltaproteobacteria bacterium]|nr:hypothetical protein [Deltaproteobacteria bacterium]MBU52023.1 hypothetical protein [Deltaproteobacteria bacterium]
MTRKIGGSKPNITNITRPNESIEIKRDDKSTSIKSTRTTDRSTFERSVETIQGWFRSTTNTSRKETTSDYTNERTAKYVNGRKTNDSSSTSTTNGNMTSSTQYDRAYNRNGGVDRQRITQQVVTKYGDHASIGRTNITEGSFQSEAINYTNTRGNTTRSTVITSSSGAETSRIGDGLQYRNGRYLNGGNFGKSRYVQGRYESNTGVNYTNERRNERQTTITRDSRADVRGTDADNSRLEARQARADRHSRYQKGMNIAADMGLRTTLLGGGTPTTRTIAGNDPTKTVSADGRTTTETLLGPRVSTTQYGEVTLGADGLRARGNADVRAGLYAQTSASHKLDGGGTVHGSAGAKAEVYAEANGFATLNTQGLEARGYAAIGSEVSAEVSGGYRTDNITIGGEKFDAGVSARGRVAAEATAYAKGHVKFTGNPPAAVLEGQAGASAVVKAEGDVQVDAGPFSVKAEGYVSAGAEAQANGSIGYDDGKLTLSFGAGAALGVGAGGRVQVAVDVGAIGKATVGVVDDQLDKLDVTGDDNFDMQDVRAIGSAAVDAAEDVAEDIGDAVVGGAKAVGGAVADGAKAVGEFFSGW